MACISGNCNDKDDCRSDIWDVCQCCRLVDGDNTIKRVCWCGVCGKYICMECMPNIPKRTLAFGENIIEKVGEAVASIVETVKEKLKPKGRTPKSFPTDEFSKEDEVNGTT